MVAGLKGGKLLGNTTSKSLAFESGLVGNTINKSLAIQSRSPLPEPKVSNVPEISNAIKLEESQQEKRDRENTKEREEDTSTETNAPERSGSNKKEEAHELCEANEPCEANDTIQVFCLVFMPLFTCRIHRSYSRSAPLDSACTVRKRETWQHCPGTCLCASIADVRKQLQRTCRLHRQGGD